MAAGSISMLSRRLCRSVLSNPRFSYHKLSMPFSTDQLSSREDSDPDEFVLKPDIDSAPDSVTSESSSEPSSQRAIFDRPLENGLDVGIYKAIVVGQVGQSPLQKRLKSGKTVTLFSVGTGGIRNNRRPLDNEDPREYANRCSIQWHRISVYPERLGSMVMKHVVPGSLLYLEGNLETKIFSDPITGLVRRIREVAIRQNGRVVFLGKGGDDQQSTPRELRSVGYY
ncbi:Single-stranded DNA-binding protein, mitochondrial [Quillaja saponaria]|uniref:Single-stranded DNA-binding protein, mitochondrial n=1 Tax=Quillaja saponaria TaxID=32244 RepID=A0AAD7LF34_QUISA|nr:Single-stranded DNA-binding protein, mitochondrial [Quillaja saponaria]